MIAAAPKVAEDTIESTAEQVAAKAEEASEAPVAEAAEEPVAEEPAEAPVTEAAEEPVAEEPAEAAEADMADISGEEEEEEKAAEFRIPESISEVISRLQQIVEDPTNSPRQELDMLKQTFYRLVKVEQEEEFKDFVADGGEPEEFQPKANPAEEQYKKLMNIIRERRAAAQEALEAFRKENYVRKLAILDRFKALIEKSNTEPTSYNDFRELLQEWKDIKEVPADKANELWKSFQQYAERFYDIQKLNAEFREYDFKKNLESKIRLCEQAEKLCEEPDPISAFHQLQKLHQEYREIGPVAKESREEVWNRFKAASTIINRRHQQHFEEIKKSEQEHLDQKTVICEIVEGIDYATLTRYQDWNNKTQEILALQTKWKGIGRAPQKSNSKIFERFRSACDTFFEKKAEFFKQVKENMGDNLEKKTRLCEEAEALKDSTEWKATTEKFQALRQQWKEIGPVAKKYSNTLWKRFNAACDAFFEKRNNTLSSQRSEESANLKSKKEILEKLRKYDPSTITEQDERDIQALISEWNSIGHIPFKFKDAVAKEYKRICDILSSTVNLRVGSRTGFGGGRSAQRESASSPREKLQRQFDALKSEIQTYENNLGFLNASSKSGNSLVSSIQEKIQKLKDEAASLLQQIKEMDKSDSKSDTDSEAEQ